MAEIGIEYITSTGKSYETPKVVDIRTTRVKELGLLLRDFGFKLEKQTIEGKPYLFATCRGLVLRIAPTDQLVDCGETMLHFAVDSLEAALWGAIQRQATIVKPVFETRWGRRAIIGDPDGRQIIFTERLPTSATDDLTIAPTPSPVVGDGSQDDPEFIARRSRALAKVGRSETDDLPRALSAVKRGTFVVLLGILLQLTAVGITVYLRRSIVNRNDSAAVVAAESQAYFAAMLAGVGVLCTLIGKMLCVFPNTQRVNYYGLVTACGIEVIVVMINLISESTTDAISIAGQFALLLVPMLYVGFLQSIARVVDDEQLRSFAVQTNRIYFAVLIGAAVLYWLAQNQVLTPPAALLIGAIAAAVYALVYIVLLIRVLFTTME